MRVLVVDQDSTLLTAITRTLGEYFSIDAVTTKADCLDLVRLNEFEVIVAGERLEDGSGLELLGSLARSRPEMLRIFAAERERLKLLKGRLGPFGLFRTLSYPIEPRQLLAALSAAAGIEEEVEETTEAQESAPPPAPEPPAPEPAARRAAPASGPSRPTAATASSPTYSRAQPQGGAAVATPSRPQPQTFAFAPAPSRAPASASAASTNTSRSQVATPAPSRTSAQTARAGRPTAGASAGSASRQPARQPTPAALAAASKLDIVTRPKGFPPPSETSPARSAFLVGAGVILVLGGLALSFKIFNTKDEPVKIAMNAAATHSPHFPPEVVKLVSDTEVAFQQDDFKTARTDVAALQQIAPDHPRLPFFESLLKRLEVTTQGPRKMFSRHTSAPTASSGSRGSSAQPSDTLRRQPDTNRDAASATPPLPSAPSTQRAPNTGVTFSGRTIEETSVTTPTQPPANLSQATTPPIPRRPGSAAAPSDTQ
jgi:DNA-binding NarL/FixJ family response regulator